MYKIVKSIHELKEYIGSSDIVSFDFETAPDEQYRTDVKAALDPHKSHIVGISFSVSKGSGVYCPMAHRMGVNIGNIAALWEYLASLFADHSIIKIAHNLAFESMFLYARGIVLKEPCYDTIAAAQMTLKSNTVFRNLSDSGLKTLVPELLDTELPTFADVTNGRYFDELDPADDEIIRYVCADADYTLRLYHLFNGWFDKWLPRHRWIVEHRMHLRKARRERELMARREIKLPDDLEKRLSHLADKTDEIIPKVLEAGGEVVLAKVRGILQSVLSPNATGELENSLGLSPAKQKRDGSGWDVKIGFKEPRSDGGSNAKIANILEYGKHNQPPRPFLKPAKSASRNAAIQAMTDKFNAEVDSI